MANPMLHRMLQKLVNLRPFDPYKWYAISSKQLPPVFSAQWAIKDPV